MNSIQLQCSNLQKSYPIVNLLHSTYFFETNFSVFLRQTLSYFETNFRVYHVHSLQNQMANTGAIFFFYKAELLQVGTYFFCTQFPSLGIFINKNVGFQKKNKTTYSRVHKSSESFFSKILEKPSIVQKKMIPHIKGLHFSQR